MKRIIITTCFLFGIHLAIAQELKVNETTNLSYAPIVSKTSNHVAVPTNTEPVVFYCSVPGQLIMAETKNIPFKVYELNQEEEKWYTKSQLFSAIQSKVPGFRISGNPNQMAQITSRGSSNITIIVDGIRYDASILDTLNALDIATVRIVNSVAGANYYRNNPN